MNNMNEIINTMRKSIDTFEERINRKTIKDSYTECGYAPTEDRTHITLWVEFDDGEQVSIPIGWYQGEPTEKRNEMYADGDIICIL